MGAKRKLARRAVKRTYGSRRLSSCAPTAIAKDILAAPIGRSSSRQEAATAKRGGAGGEPHNGASLRSRRAAPVPAEHKNSRPRQPRVFIGPLAVGWILNLAVEWRPQRGQRLFLRSHCFRSSPSPCLPSCGRKSSPATVDRYDGQKSPVRQRDARQPSSASTHGAVCQLTLRPRVFDERLAGLLAARRGGGFATSDLSDSMLRRSASIRLMTFCADG